MLTHLRNHPVRPLIALSLAVTLVAACGDDDEATTTRPPQTTVAGSDDTTPTGAPAPEIPATGPGWNANTVSIGVIWASNKPEVFKSLNITAGLPGNAVAQADSIAKHYNDDGGILGRQVEIKYDDHDLKLELAQPAVEAQNACTHFTEDEPVIAVVNSETSLDTDILRKCLADAGIPLLAMSVSPYDDQLLSELHGLYFPTFVPSWDDLAPVYMKSLGDRGYFDGWNTTDGGPGSAPVKVGLWLEDTPVGGRIADLISAALKQAGHDPVVVYKYKDAGKEAEGAVLQMRDAGVTHLVALQGRTFLFATAAEAQGFRPRYALTTGNGPNEAMQKLAPAPQNIGAMGFGTNPGQDVDDPSKAATPGRELCLGILKDGGVVEGERFAENIALTICDSIRLVADASVAGGDFTDEAILAGVAKIGPDFKGAVTFKSGLGADSSVFAGAGEDFAYDTTCSCYQYTSNAPRDI